MKTITLLRTMALVGLMLLTTVGWGQIVIWNPSGLSGYGPSPWTPTTANEDITAVGLSRASGIGTSGTAASNAWGGTMTVSGATIESAIAGNQFVYFSITADQNYLVSFSSFDLFYRRSSTGPQNGLLQYSIDGSTYNDISTIAFPSSSSSGAAISQIDLSAISELQDVADITTTNFRIVLYNNTGAGTWYVFNTGLAIGGNVAPAGTIVANPQFNPPAGTYYETQFVAISTPTDGATIYYTDDGTDPDEFSTEYIDPIEISETTTLKAIAFKEGYDPSNIATALYNFPPINNVADIATLRTGTADGVTGYKFSGEAILVAKDGFNNRKFIEDETAAIMIFDQAGIITGTYDLGDGMQDITGVLTIANNMLRFVPVLNAGPASTTGNPVVPTLFEIDELTSDDQAKLVKLENITFITAGTFANGQNYTITDGTNNLIVRTDFFNVDYIGTAIPTVAQDLTGVIIQFNENLQIVPRFLADFENTVFAVDPPASFTSAAISPSEIELTFATNMAGDDVVIVFNETGVFDEPSGTPPAPGQPFADGTLLYAGTDSPQIHSGLDPEETVYYKAWSYDGSAYSPGLTANATTFATEPSNHATDFIATTNSFSSITVFWEDSDAAAYLIKGSTVGFGDIGVPVDGVAEADGGLVKNVLAGIESHEFTGIDPDTEHFFKIFPYNGSGATVNYKTDDVVPQASATTDAILGYFVDFEGEGETKGSYDAGTVNLSGLDWDMTQALIGTAAGDVKNGLRSGRMRRDGEIYGSMTMLGDKPNGIGTITFLYCRSNFSGDRTGISPSFAVEYSTDAGNNWIQAGDETSLAGINSLTEFSAIVDVAGNVRVRIRQVSGDAGKRWNVDDIHISDFDGIPENLPLDGITLGENDIECYNATNNITVTNSTIGDGAFAEFRAGVSINFGEGFIAESGSHVIAVITDVYCSLPESMLASEEVVIPAETPVMPDPASLFRVYPNPTAGIINLEFMMIDASSKVVTELYNMMGERLLQDEVFGTATHQLDVSAMPRGIYIVRIIIDGKAEMQKIIKQ